MPLPPLPHFILPALWSRIGQALPQQPPCLALVSLLNLARQRVLPMDTLSALEGRHIQVCVKDAGMRLDFSLQAGRFVMLAAPAPPHPLPDLIISATLRDYLALALREEDADSLFFARRLRLEGNTELGLLVKNTLDPIDWQALPWAHVRGLA